MTSYTYQVTPATTVPEWLRICARAFFYDVGFRDPLPTGEDLSSYEESVRQAEEQMRLVLSLTPAEAEASARAQYEQMTRERDKYRREQLDKTVYFRSLYDKTRAWDAPGKFRYLKRFALRELRLEISRSRNLSFWPRPKLRSGEEWRRDAVEMAREDLQRARQRLANVRRRNKYTGEWVRDLKVECEKLDAAIQSK